MSEIITSRGAAQDKKDSRLNKHLHVDLTPMVDLAFLLISFFMLTTTLLDQRSMELKQPEKGPLQAVSECQLLNILTDSAGHVYCWQGLECKAVERVDGELRARISQSKQ